MRGALIIMGASVRAAAFSAIEAGLSPYAIDQFADRDLAEKCPAIRISRYPREFSAALSAAPDAPWIYTGGLENYPRLVDRLAAIRPLLGNGGQALRAVRDPWQLAAVTREAGLRFPTIARTGAEITAVGFAGQWLIKPFRGSGGMTLRFATAKDLSGPTANAYFQQYIAGEAASAVFIAAGRRAMLLGASRVPGRDFGLTPPFLYVGSIAPLLLRADELSKLATFGESLVMRFNLRGLFNVDFVRTGKELWPVEVNPRYSASVEVLERATGGSFIPLHLAACQEDPIPALPNKSALTSIGKAVVYAGTESIVPPEFDSLVQEWNRPGQLPGIADLPSSGQPVACGQPVATVLVEGSGAAEIETELRRRVAIVSAVMAKGSAPC